MEGEHVSALFLLVNSVHQKRRWRALKTVSLGVVTFAIATLAVLLMACSADNEAKSNMPEASELCCHGNWEVLEFDSESGPEEGRCIDWQEPQFHEAHACWNRLYRNNSVRPGEPERLTVTVSVMQNSADASDWLPSFWPGTKRNDPKYAEIEDPLVGEAARAWDLTTDDLGFIGTEAAFYRDNLAVVVFANGGTAEQRQIMFESVDEAVVDRIVGYR